ncbi:cellulase family glycosylhydrolase [Paenibacillus sp.]|uniref:cellulase family glycosylhydrolase n=1 Tax=Paenibacillus sp. TaxID=58172 RepID=UPI002810C5DF|nr:cellulase family glycosylhydrolase [Paenibacillus sp.]
MERNRTTEVSGFLRASGTKLVNGSGEEVLLRGVGFGSWLLPEGYMWRFPNGGDRPRKIERMIEELIGADKAARFWALYYDRYISEADVRAVAAEGFNSVRIPINARLLIEQEEPLRCREKYLQLLDRVIGWCRDHAVYAILDLHGAPGGQTGTNIDDSEFDRPDLFTSERNRRMTIELWRLLAARYKDEWIVAGYDLLNEPLPEWFSSYNDRVMPLYKDIVRAIREVDEKHMIILEGVHWATDWSIFDEKLDDNLMLQFHKYWNHPDTESLRPFLERREAWNVPIFMGEGGENNCDWYVGAFGLYEDHGISWNFWTWKKMDCDNSPYSVPKPDGWPLLVAYLEGGARPAAETAERILWDYVDALPLERCAYRPQVANALLRRPPLRIPGAFYGCKGEGVSYGFGPEARPRPRPKATAGFRAGDRTDIRFVDSRLDRPNFQHMGGEPWQADEWMYVHLEEGEWLAYEFVVPVGGADSYTLESMVSSDGYGEAEVRLDGVPVASLGVARREWHTLRTSGFPAGPGTRRVTIRAARGSIGLQWLYVHA